MSSENNEEYIVKPPRFSMFSDSKQTKMSHPNTELVDILTVYHVNHLLRAMTDTSASSNIFRREYTSKQLIKHDKHNKQRQYNG
jgi:hypothetical protein